MLAHLLDDLREVSISIAEQANRISRSLAHPSSEGRTIAFFTARMTTAVSSQILLDRVSQVLFHRTEEARKVVAEIEDFENILLDRSVRLEDPHLSRAPFLREVYLGDTRDGLSDLLEDLRKVSDDLTYTSLLLEVAEQFNPPGVATVQDVEVPASVEVTPPAEVEAVELSEAPSDPTPSASVEAVEPSPAPPAA